MTRTRWIAAALAAIVVVPYCMHMERMLAPATSTAAPSAARAASDEASASASTTATMPSSARWMASRARPAIAATPAGGGVGAPTGGGAGAPAAAPATNAAEPAAGALPPVSSDAWSAGKFADFSREELEEMAARCELRWQMPRAPSDRYQSAVRALYVELTGDDAERSARIMDDTLRAESDAGAIDAHKRLAERRAGGDAPASGSVYERYLQLQLDEAERARRDGDALGPKYTMTGCDPDHALFRSGR